MKHVLAPILLLVFLFPSLTGCGEEVTRDDLVVREGLWYNKFSDVLFTGKITGQMQATFKNGVLDGPYVFYWGNAQVMTKGSYKNGVKDGPWVSYRKDGTVDEKDTETYKNGVKID